jgi:hypothetical protein
MILFFSSRFFWFLVGLEFELRALHLQSRHFTACATPPVRFARIILEMGGLEPCWGWPRTVILPISASQVAKIIDMSHWRPAASRLLMVYHQ